MYGNAHMYTVCYTDDAARVRTDSENHSDDHKHAGNYSGTDADRYTNIDTCSNGYAGDQAFTDTWCNTKRYTECYAYGDSRPDANASR